MRSIQLKVSMDSLTVKKTIASLTNHNDIRKRICHSFPAKKKKWYVTEKQLISRISTFLKVNLIGEVFFLILIKPLFFLIDTCSTNIMVEEVEDDVFDNDKCVF